MTKDSNQISIYNGPSMNPTFVAGDKLIIVTYSSPDEINVGDVVTFRHPFKEIDVVHRVIEIKGAVIKTQGDNQKQPDVYDLSNSDIQGKVVEIKRGGATFKVANGDQGIKLFNALQKNKKYRALIAKFLNPLYKFFSNLGLISGLIPLQCVKFKRKGGEEYQLIRKECCLGRKKAGSDKWEIKFPYRLFVIEKKLPEIPLGPLTVLFRHLINFSPWKWLALTFFYYNFVTITFNLLQHPILDKRVQVFAGMFFLFSILSAIISGRKELSSLINKKEWCFIGILIFLGLASGISCKNYPSGLYRIILVLLTSCGGFVCSRILLKDKVDKYIFFGFNLLMLSFLIFLGFWGEIGYGHVNYLWEAMGQFFPSPKRFNIDYFLSVHLHYWVDLILLSSIAPLSLIFNKKSRQIIIGVSLLMLAYFILILTRLRSTVLIPWIAAFSFIFYFKFNLKRTLAIFIVLILGFLTFYKLSPEKINRLTMTHATIAYRLENYPFSLSIALQHPVLGIGLRAPRTKFLPNYQLHFQHSSESSFKEKVKKTVTSENIILTFLAGAGFPFTIIFFTALFGIIIKGYKYFKKGNSAEEIFHPVALIICILLCLIHGMLYDIFLFSRVSWYFFVFLGLIPFRKPTGVKVA